MDEKVLELLDSEARKNLFLHIVERPGLGMKKGDGVIISKSLTPGSGNIVLLSNEVCRPWLMRLKDAAKEIENGCRILGVATVLSRDLLPNKGEKLVAFRENFDRLVNPKGGSIQ